MAFIHKITERFYDGATDNVAGTLSYPSISQFHFTK